MTTLPDTITFEQIEKQGLFDKAKRINKRKRRGIWSEIMLLGALNEIWERIYINGESLYDMNVVAIRAKYNVASFKYSEIEFLGKLTDPPTISDARRVRQCRRDSNKLSKQRCEIKTKPDIENVEFESVVNCDEDEWMIKNLINARDWLNEHGYVCEVKLTKILL